MSFFCRSSEGQFYIYVQAAHLFEYLKELAWLESETTYRVLGSDLKSTIPRRLVPLKFLCCNESRYFNAEERLTESPQTATSTGVNSFKYKGFSVAN